MYVSLSLIELHFENYTPTVHRTFINSRNFIGRIHMRTCGDRWVVESFLNNHLRTYIYNGARRLPSIGECWGKRLKHARPTSSRTSVQSGAVSGTRLSQSGGESRVGARQTPDNLRREVTSDLWRLILRYVRINVRTTGELFQFRYLIEYMMDIKRFSIRDA